MIAPQIAYYSNNKDSDENKVIRLHIDSPLSVVIYVFGAFLALLVLITHISLRYEDEMEKERNSKSYRRKKVIDRLF